MGSRGKDQTAPHQPLLSSLVIRPTDDNGDGGDGVTDDRDYETRELDREPTHYSRADRFGDGPGLFRFLSCFLPETIYF